MLRQETYLVMVAYKLLQHGILICGILQYLCLTTSIVVCGWRLLGLRLINLTPSSAADRSARAVGLDHLHRRLQLLGLRLITSTDCSGSVCERRRS